MEKQVYEGKNICHYCNIAFDKNIRVCPQCGKEVRFDGKNVKLYKETYHEGPRVAGGIACDYCGHCYGSYNWCPFLD